MNMGWSNRSMTAFFLILSPFYEKGMRGQIVSRTLLSNILHSLLSAFYGTR